MAALQPRQTDVAAWAIKGVATGVGAGIVFAMFEMIVAEAMGMGLFAPLRMIGAIALGPAALDPSYSLAGAAIGGLALHLVLSAVYGAVAGVAVAALPPLRAHPGVLVGATTVYGLGLWLLNFFLIAPVAFPWFTQAPPLVQFVAHTVFFGTVLGLLLLAVRGRSLQRGRPSAA